MFAPVEDFNTFLADIGSVIWGPFVLIPLLLGTGLFLTIRLRALQFRKLAPALRLGLVKRKDDGGEGEDRRHTADGPHLRAGRTPPAGLITHGPPGGGP